MRRGIAVACSLVLFGTLLGTGAGASHVKPGGPTKALGVQPDGVHNNPTCADLIDAGAFLYEEKFEPVQDVKDLQLSFGGLTGTLSVDVYDVKGKPSGQAFDFTFTGDFVGAGIFVKGGPNGNLYDYRPAHAPGAAADTFLHAPLNDSDDGKFYGLSHISFCIAEGQTELEITKTAVKDPITIGDAFAYDITVGDVADGIDAENVVVTDALVPDGFDWTIVSQDGTACSVSDGDTDGNTDDLECTFSSLADGSSYSVRVETDSTATVADCDQKFTNIAYASADNADQVSDDASITVACGGVKVVKTAKHKDASTSPNLAATFRITDVKGVAHDVTTDGTTGLACVSNLPVGSASVYEVSGPSGYAMDTDTEVVTVTDADCDSGSEVTASFENIPLTDISWSVDSQHDGATLTKVVCTDSEGNKVQDIVSDGSGSITGLEPTDSDLTDGTDSVTLTCEFTVDP